MPESADYPTEEPCENCGQLIDTLDLPPLTSARCPHCDHPNLFNTQFHHFKLLEIIGSGGMGAVYRAQDQSLDRTVALKLLRTEHMLDEAIVAQFEKEAALTASINHPSIVRIFSTGADRGVVYMVMELVDKGSLDDLINIQGRVAEAQALEIGIQIARGLQAAWGGGLLHRDVKPGNILFNETHTAKIVDFGLATLAGESGQIGGEIWGTPYYVAPEKLETPPSEDFRSDIYSLGSALFHAIAGHAPYDANDTSILVLKSLKSQPVSLRDAAPEVSDATIAVIDRMLSINPDTRYQSYDELIGHLQFARKEIAEGVARPLATPVPEKSSRWLAMTVAALVAGVGLYFLLQHQGKRTSSPAATQAPAMMNDAAARSAAARRLLVEGDATGAAAAFRELDRDTVPQPLRSWNALQGVLAQLLAGRTEEAATAAGQIVEPPATSTSAPGRFFIETATLAAAPAPPATASADNFAPGNHEAFALLIGGVKHWMAGNFSDAVIFFTRFQRVTPTDPHAWIAEYHPLAASFVAEHATFTRVSTDAKAAPAGNKKEALEAVRQARTQLKHPALAGLLGMLETQLAAEAAAYDATMAERLAADDAADATILRAMEPQIDTLCRQFRLAEAAALARGVQVRGEKHKPALAFLQQRVTWMADFKAAFFKDLRTAHYEAEVRTVTNSKLGPGIWVPTETKIKVMTKRGDFETPWTNVHPQALIDAVTACVPALTPEQAADRKWGLGLYLHALRLEAQARPLLTEASTARAQYAAALPQLGLKPPP